MSYTFIPKPSGTTYRNTNAAGKQQYDQVDIEYDDASVFYDGVDENMYTFIPKPSQEITYRGMTAGLLIPLTIRSSVLIDPYTYIPKPN